MSNLKKFSGLSESGKHYLVYGDRKIAELLGDDKEAMLFFYRFMDLVKSHADMKSELEGILHSVSWNQGTKNFSFECSSEEGNRVETASKTLQEANKIFSF